MKKIILITVLIVILLVSGAILIVADRSITVTSERRVKATELGIANYTSVDYSKDGEWQRCLVSDKSVTNYNLPCSDFMLERQLDNWEETTINEILATELDRDSRITRTRQREGTTELQ